MGSRAQAPGNAPPSSLGLHPETEGLPPLAELSPTTGSGTKAFAQPSRAQLSQSPAPASSSTVATAQVPMAQVQSAASAIPVKQLRASATASSARPSEPSGGRLAAEVSQASLVEAAHGLNNIRKQFAGAKSSPGGDSKSKSAAQLLHDRAVQLLELQDDLDLVVLEDMSDCSIDYEAVHDECNGLLQDPKPQVVSV